MTGINPLIGGALRAGARQVEAQGSQNVAQTVVIEGENILPKSVRFSKVNLTAGDMKRIHLKFVKENGKSSVEFITDKNVHPFAKPEKWEIGDDVTGFEVKKVADANRNEEEITLTITYKDKPSIPVRLYGASTTFDV